MVPFLRNPVAQIWRRRLLAAITLVAYLATAIGFPVPEARGTHHACGQDVCGCGTPEQCKASGCACPHREVSEPETTDDAEPSCCAKKKQDSEAPPSCCVKKPTEPRRPKNSTKPNTVRWVVGISAQKCRGGASHRISADVALPSPTPMIWLPSWPYRHSLSVLQLTPFVHAEAPLDPPPRIPAA